VVIHLVAGLDPVDGVAERARGAVPDRPDDFVHPPAAGGDERLAAPVEDRRQPVGAETGMLAGAPVVQDGDLLPGVAITVVGNPVRLFRAGESGPGVRAVAPRFYRRRAAAAQGHLRAGGQGLAQPVMYAAGIGDQVRPVGRHLDSRLQPGLERPQLGEPGLGCRVLGVADGQVLQRCGRLRQLGLVRMLGQQCSRRAGHVPQRLVKVTRKTGSELPGVVHRYLDTGFLAG